MGFWKRRKAKRERLKYDPNLSYAGGRGKDPSERPPMIYVVDDPKDRRYVPPEGPSPEAKAGAQSPKKKDGRKPA